MTTDTNHKDTRLVAPVSPEIQEIIQRAADYSAASLSQFIIESTLTRARHIIEHTETLHLSMSAADALYSALENPPKASNKLLKAAQSYKCEVGVNIH